MIEPIASIDPEHDAERLEVLRARVLALRIPVLLSGLIYLLYAGLSVLSGLSGLVVIIGAGVSSGNTVLEPFMIFNVLSGVLSALVDLAVAAALVGSGAFGFAARAEPAYLVRSARLLLGFWWLMLFRLLLAVTGLLLTMAAFGAALR